MLIKVKGLFKSALNLSCYFRIQALHSNNKQIIQLEHNWIKNPNWQVATSWLFTSMAEDLNLG